jgi:hypothetical protein
MQTPRMGLRDIPLNSKQVVDALGNGDEFDKQGGQRIQDDGQDDPRKKCHDCI